MFVVKGYCIEFQTVLCCHIVMSDNAGPNQIQWYVHCIVCLLQNQMARLAFSIVTEAEEDQICFIAATEYEHNMWCDGLNVLLGNEVSVLCYSLLLFSEIEKETHSDKDVLVCGNTHMHACKNPCMYTHMHTHSHMHIRACTHTHTHAHAHVPTHTHTHTVKELAA